MVDEGNAVRCPFTPEAKIKAASPQAWPTHSVKTGGPKHLWLTRMTISHIREKRTLVKKKQVDVIITLEYCIRAVNEFSRWDHGKVPVLLVQQEAKSDYSSLC